MHWTHQTPRRFLKSAPLFFLSLFFMITGFLLPGTLFAAPPRVICVPQVPTDLLVPHDTWAGEPTILKGTARDPDGDLMGGTYYWEFGDGDASAPAAITDSSNLAATHTYSGDPGTLFVARLHVTDAGGESSSDDYRVIVRDRTLDVEVNKAIDDGLWWLYTQRTGVYSIIPSSAFTTPEGFTLPAGQQGLIGQYFNNFSFSGDPALTRIDPNIDFVWPSGASPGTGVNSDFSARWRGKIHVPEDGYYMFGSNNDDGTRLFVDGIQLINDWSGHPPQWLSSKPIFLNAGEHDFQVDFYDGASGGQAKIYWSSVYRWSNTGGGGGYDGYYANSTASAVQAFEINGHLETGNPDEDPYVDAVRGGMDYLMCWRLIECFREGLPPDMDVYDGAAWSAPAPLSELSVAQRSAPVPFPDFTRGGWSDERA